MSTDPFDRHSRRAAALRAAVENGRTATEASLRAAVMARAAGGPPTTEPYDALARQVGEAAHRVTDDQVSAVRAAAGSDAAAFEIVMSACVGAGLTRWDAAVRAIEEARDATG